MIFFVIISFGLISVRLMGVSVMVLKFIIGCLLLDMFFKGVMIIRFLM